MRRHELLVLLALASCGVPVATTAGLAEPSGSHADCASPLLCLDGCCLMESSGACSPGEFRCRGSEVERCVAGDPLPLCPQVRPADWVAVEGCLAGCANGACKPVCNPGQAVCNDGRLFRCNNGGTGWALEQDCANGCAPGACAPEG